MATGFNDALQLFQGGTGESSTTGGNGLELPEGSETLSDLIKLNYDFPVEPNVPTPQSYNIYIWNNNDNGEIRFYTKDAKNNNDYNKDYFSGNYSEPRLNFNTKIGGDGKLYYWHNFTVVNPAKLSGWYELDGNFNSVEAQLTALDAFTGALAVVNTGLQQQINVITGNITFITQKQTATDQVVINHEVRVKFLETTKEKVAFDFNYVGGEYNVAEKIAQARKVFDSLSKKSLGTFTLSIAKQRIKVKNSLSTLIYSIVNNSLTLVAVIGFTATIFGILKEILDVKKKKMYESEIAVIADTLAQLPVSQNNDTINHLGLTILSGNGGFPPALPNQEFSVPIQRDAILKFGIDSSFNAYLITVEQYGETDFTVGESISINRNLINGGVGTLVLTVSSLGTLKQWTELRTAYLQNKVYKLNTKSRRKNLVVGHDDVNTDQFTNVDTTYTDYDEQGAETITYKVLKSRINLLPSGVGDVDLYTSTGKMGIGTIPTTKLHVFDDITNETKLTIQNTSNILLQTPSSSSIDLNITDNAVIDYNVGNYDGNFKVISKNGGSITDQIVIDSSGRIGIGTPPSAVHKLYVNGAVFSDRYIGFNVNVGKLSNIELNVYKATNPTIRIESDEGGTPILELMKGTTADVNKDYRFISENETLKLQYQDNLTLYTNDSNQLLSFNNVKTVIHKNLECSSNVGIGTEAHATIKLDVNGNSRLTGNLGIGTEAATELHIYKTTNPAIRIQSLAEGTPSIDFMRGVLNDVNKDFRIVSDTDTFKLQYQDNINSYGNNNNQLIWANATDTIIHKPTEFKANVLIGGDTRTVGYVGIGTTASTALHVYTAAANILRLQTAPVNGTNSIEFMRGNSTDPLTDYRIFTNLDGKFKIQYANNLLAYGDAETDLIELSTTNTIIYKPTEIKGNVGIGTTPHATYKVDVNGTINATAFIGNGAGLTDLGADKITTGSLNLDRITLTTSKLYQNFNTTNFAIINDKIDLPPNYSINITDYDSQTLFGLSTERKYKGKMTANYDDRNGVYKLITTDNRTNNVAVLNYKVGDKISIRNTATVANDYLLESGSRYYNSLLLIKRPNNIPLNWAVNDAYNVLLYEWNSSDGLEGRPEARVRTPTNRYFPFTTVMTFLIEAGFNYYLCKLYNTVEVSGSSLIVVASGYGDDYNDFNRAFGAGQTFKLQITGTTFADDYLPTEYIGADIGIASDRRLGGVKKGRGVAIDATTGVLDAIPISSDLITNMNTSHFTNNTGTGKIDISSTYVAPSTTKLATARNIAGTAFDGTANINITYGNLSSIPATWGESQIPSLPISKITNLQTTLDGKAPTSHTHVIGDVTNLQTTLDGKAPTSHTHSIANITNLQTTLDGKAPTSHTHAIADITNLQTTLDAKQATLTAGTGITITGTTISSTSTFTPTSANTIGIFNTTQFVNNTTTSKIDINVNWKPTTAGIADSAMQLVSSRNIAGVGFNGTASIGIPYFNLDFKPTAGTGISITAGSATTSPVISSTLTAGSGINISASNVISSTGAFWANVLGPPGPFQVVYDDIYFAIAKVGIGSSAMPSALFHIRGNATNAGTMIVEHQSATPNIELVRGLTSSSTDFNWRILNDNSFKIQNKTSTNAYADRFAISSAGNVGIGTNNPLQILQVGAGGRLRIANGNTDYSLIGCDDADSATNTRIVVSGSARAGNIGNIDYVSTSTGVHRFYTTSSGTERMRINNNGAVGIQTTGYAIANNFMSSGSLVIGNLNQNYGGGNNWNANTAGLLMECEDNTEIAVLDNGVAVHSFMYYTTNGNIRIGRNMGWGVANVSFTGSATIDTNLTVSGTSTLTGRVGIGKAPHATYACDVNGTLNATALFVGGTAITGGSKWTTATDTTRIFYNGGNVGIGTTNPSNILQVGTGSRLRISNGNYDYTVIGSSDTEGSGNTRIVIYGDGFPFGTAAGNIQYTATSTGKHIFYTGGTTERMRIDQNGNISMNNELLVSGNKLVITGISPTLYLRDTNHRSGMIHMNDNIMYFLSGVANSDSWTQVNSQWPLYLDTATNTSYFGGLVYINNGNTDNNAAKLLVSGSDGNGISAYFYHPNRSQGIGIAYDGLSALGYNTNQNIVMRPRGTGIFEVATSTFITTTSAGYLGPSGAFVIGTPIGWQICAKFNASVWCTNLFISSSDSRIKEDIQDINDDDALNKLLAIEPKTYKYVDKIARGDKKVYGFIAQQIREVIPEAVKIEKSFIPNIMLIGDIVDYIITLPSQPEKVIIKVDDKIRCIDDKGEDVLVKVEEVIDELTFKIKAIDDMRPLEYTHDKIFIHGTEVEDFHTLTKEYIFTLNVCATQELHRRIISQEERIKELELKVERLLNYISA